MRTMLITALALGLIAQPASTQWVEMPGRGHDVAIGHYGGTYLIGMDNAVWSWTGSTWTRLAGAGGVRISVGPGGNPWTVGPNGGIWRWNGTELVRVGGLLARDIAVTARAFWAIGQDGQLYELVDEYGAMSSGGRWQVRRCNRFNVKFHRVAVHPNGDAWLVAADDSPAGETVVNGQRVPIGPGSVFRVPLGQSDCYNLPNAGANDVGVGANGSVWVIGRNSTGAGWGTYRYAGDPAYAGMDGTPDRGWLGMGGSASQISVDPQGKAWVLNASSVLYRAQ